MKVICFGAALSAVCLSACSTLIKSEAATCQGTFNFSGIAAALRRDAYTTIEEFDTLDNTVRNRSVHQDGELNYTIIGVNDACDVFSRSFLSSEMPEFSGLRYIRVR
jgi:hypothetical protein